MNNSINGKIDIGDGVANIKQDFVLLQLDAAQMRRESWHLHQLIGDGRENFGGRCCLTAAKSPPRLSWMESVKT